MVIPLRMVSPPHCDDLQLYEQHNSDCYHWKHGVQLSWQRLCIDNSSHRRSDRRQSSLGGDMCLERFPSPPNQYLVPQSGFSPPPSTKTASTPFAVVDLVRYCLGTFHRRSCVRDLCYKLYLT